MTALKKIRSHPDVADYFKELPFYNKHIEKPKIRCLKNVIKRNHAFRGYTMSYKVKLVEKKDTKQLEASKSSIKDFLNETKRF